MSARVVVISGPDNGKTFILPPGQTFQIGRSQATPTQLTDESVSRVHCEIEYDGEQATLINISSNGTVVNGRRADRQELRHGDVLRLGATECRVELAPAEAGADGEGLEGLVGQTLAHYAIEAVVAPGNLGTVFRARDTDSDQVVALKVLRPDFSHNDEEMQRFVRAMKTVLPLRHPNLVTLYAAGKTAGHCWMAMEHVEGESMTQVIRRIGIAGMLDWRYGFRVAVRVARALEYAHDKSIIHRNVTPQNILFRTADKEIKLGDLMLAKAVEGALARQVTRPGEILGDVAYLAPERTFGTGEIDGRADLYGLGATVYALIAGRPPFVGRSLPELLPKIRNEEPEKPRKFQMSIPELFQGTVMRLLEKDPDQRYASATDLLADLERVGKFTGAGE